MVRYGWTFELYATVCTSFVSLPKSPQRSSVKQPSTLLLSSTPSSNQTSDVESDSLSHTVGSPEKYAAALGMTLEQVQIREELREESVRELQEQLEGTFDGKERHRLICQHRFKQGKHPFTCPKCWSYQPVCICGDAPGKKKTIPCEQVIIWTHHSEWGSQSNTGSVLPLVLENTRLLMKGLHDGNLESILNADPTIQPVILWPNVNFSNGNENYVTFDDLVGKKVILLAMEGTWRQARRMVSKFPYPRLSLTGGDSGSNNVPPPISILAPLRCQKDGPKHSVCTAEAVVMALEGMGLDQDPSILELVKRKVDQTRRYRGKLNLGAKQ